MLAILAEDDSDAEVLMHIARRYFNDPKMKIKKKGYDGCGGLCAKGARDIRAWVTEGIAKFIVCHDADENPPNDVRNKVLVKIVGPSGAANQCCITVPVQEIEAWLIADEQAITAVIPKFRFKGHSRPESIPSPKEWLIGQSKAENSKPLYVPKAFNAAVAKHLRFDVVKQKCPSFKAFLDCLTSTRGEH